MPRSSPGPSPEDSTTGRVAGHLQANGFLVQGRAFDSLALDASATARGLDVTNAEVTRQMMRAEFSGHAGMHDWKISASDPLTVNADLRSGDIADVLAFAGQSAGGSSGALTATVQISGTVGNPVGSANLSATMGTIEGEPFDRVAAQVTLSDQLITLSSATAERGNSRVMLAAQLHHSPDSFTTGNCRRTWRATRSTWDECRRCSASVQTLPDHWR